MRVTHTEIGESVMDEIRNRITKIIGDLEMQNSRFVAKKSLLSQDIADLGQEFEFGGTRSNEEQSFIESMHKALKLYSDAIGTVSSAKKQLEEVISRL